MRPGKAAGQSVDPADLVAIKEGFCWPALFIPLIWTVYRRLWLVLLLFLVGLILLGFLDSLGGAVVGVVFVLGRIWYALEANGLRRWTLERNGHRLIGIAEGRTIEEAESRFFATWRPAAMAPDPDEAAPPPPAAAAGHGPRPNPWRRPESDPQVVGLFPTPGSAR